MPYRRTVSWAAGASALALISAAGAVRAADLTLKRVALSTGGVGYYEYQADVAGGADLTLEVRRDQVDDVLKSVVVYDDKGVVGSVDLPGADAADGAFREAPFSADDLASPAALLQALQGAEVEAYGPQAARGRVLSVTQESAQLPNGGGTVQRHRLALNTAEGVRQVILEDVESLRFSDPKLQARLDAGLQALAAQAKRERRRLTVHVRTAEPGAKRVVRVAFVAAAPLWKASYRLTLNPKSNDKGALQGWAVLENMSGEDWRDVDLTLLSGAPATLRQALYAPYYVDRPEAPVEVAGRILPPPDGGAVAFRGEEARADVVRAMPRTATPGAPAPAMTKDMMVIESRPAALDTAQAAPAADAALTAFRIPTPVSAPDGGTLMVPIAAADVPVERLAVYQPGVHPRHPLAALRLTNPAPVALPPGVVTVYETLDGAPAHIGDARLSTLPAGDSRLASFALDQAVTVDRSDQPGRTVARVQIADGVMTLTVTERQTSHYAIAGAKDGARKLVIEHPRRAGWELAGGVKAETAAAAYRLPLDIGAGETATLSVTLERPRVERITLADLPADALLAQAQSAELPAAARQALDELAKLRVALTDAERRVAALERTREEQVKEQVRLRDNLAALAAAADLRKRTLAKMGEAETRLETVGAELAAARDAAETARRALAERVRGLTL